jgi:hypothetical protein
MILDIDSTWSWLVGVWCRIRRRPRVTTNRPAIAAAKVGNAPTNPNAPQRSSR